MADEPDSDASSADTDFEEEPVHSPPQEDPLPTNRAVPELDENSRVVGHPDVVYLRCRAEHAAHFRKFRSLHIFASMLRTINCFDDSHEFDFFWRGSLDECKVAMRAVLGGDVMSDTVAPMHLYTTE